MTFYLLINNFFSTLTGRKSTVPHIPVQQVELSRQSKLLIQNVVFEAAWVWLLMAGPVAEEHKIAGNQQGPFDRVASVAELWAD